MFDIVQTVDEYDRLALCTEILGLESSFDVRIDLNGADDLALAKDDESSASRPPLVRSRSSPHRREEQRESSSSKFPPPLTWLNGHSMRAVKENGRLLLTKVVTEQPREIATSECDASNPISPSSQIKKNRKYQWRRKLNGVTGHEVCNGVTNR